MADKKELVEKIPFIGEYELEINKKPVKGLKEILNCFTKEQLDTFLTTYSEYESFPTKKSEFVEIVYSLIKENCAQVLMYEDECAFDFYKKYLEKRNKETGICDVELYVPDISKNDDYEMMFYLFNAGLVKRLLRYGYLFKFNKNEGDEIYVIADEVYEEITKYIKKDGTHPYGSKYETKLFAEMLISKIGVLTVRDFKILWETAFPEQKMDKEEIIEFMKFSSKDRIGYLYYEELQCIADSELNTDRLVKDIFEERSRHSLIVPSQKELLEWLEDSINPGTDDGFDFNGKSEFEFKNPYYLQMKQLLGKVRKNDNDAEEILATMMFYIKDGFRMTQAINILQEDYELTSKMSRKETETFIQTYQNLHNSTHMWVNYGSSPNELSGEQSERTLQFSQQNFVTPISAPSGFVNIPKVGRNEPCPCGSGKKYKMCHGR